MSRRGSMVRRQALRAAVVATAVVALVLAAVLTATDLIVSRSQLAALDQRIADLLSEGTARGSVVGEGISDNDFDEPLLSWVAQPGGSCVAVGNAPALPPALCTAGDPRSDTVSGVEMRIAGRRLSDGRLLVAGASLTPISRQTGDLIIAELIVGPALLLLLFLGSLAVGGRVGGSVEAMRRRQLAFAADASHELRTPLSVLQAEADVALGGGDRNLRPALERVGGEIGRMRRIVEDLLWLARFDSEPEPPPATLLDLSTVARVAAERFGALASSRALTLSLEAPEDVLTVSAPAEWLDRLTGVLLDNACRHARGNVAVVVRRLPGRRVELSVRDDGEGVDDGELPLIFDRFHRATSRGEGAGLGLAIADSIVRATGGRWEVRSWTGEGSRFAVTWPLERAKSPSSAEPWRSRRRLAQLLARREAHPRAR
jgi:signal transduction histidine kinase